MNKHKKIAIKELKRLIAEIETEGSFLSEHSCIFIVESLKAILALLEK